MSSWRHEFTVFLASQQNWVVTIQRKFHLKKEASLQRKCWQQNLLSEILHNLHDIANLDYQKCQIPASHPLRTLCNQIRDDQMFSVKFVFSRKLNFLRNTFVLQMPIFHGKPDLLPKPPYWNLCCQPPILIFSADSFLSFKFCQKSWHFPEMHLVLVLWDWDYIT